MSVEDMPLAASLLRGASPASTKISSTVKRPLELALADPVAKKQRQHTSLMGAEESSTSKAEADPAQAAREFAQAAQAAHLPHPLEEPDPQPMPDEDGDVKMVGIDTVETAEQKALRDKKWGSLENILHRTSPFATAAFEKGPENLDFLQVTIIMIIENGPENLDFLQEECRILVVGAGGLGCEILKDLAVSAFADIEVIDMDTIDISNLNRQFLFRKKDTGKYKSEVAAQFIMERCEGVKVKAHTGKVQDMPKSWYKRFNIVIAGLDNIEARQFLNSMLLSCVEFDEDGEIDYDTVIPMIDGGTTGFSGQARVIIPFMTACYQCTLQSLPPEEGFHLCTLASKPRKPEHAIAYVIQVLWGYLSRFEGVEDYELSKVTTNAAGEPEEGKGAIPFDADNPKHMTWVWKRSVERAKEFKIQEPSYNMTMQVTKNIIPAIASTNAIIAAACTNEALKFLARSHPRMNSYFQYQGSTGISTETFPYARDQLCAVCVKPVRMKMTATTTTEQFLEKIKPLFKPCAAGYKHPAVNMGNKILYTSMQGQDFSEELKMPLQALGVKTKTMLTCNASDGSKQVRRVIVDYQK
eukprot:g15280.t1